MIESQFYSHSGRRDLEIGTFGLSKPIIAMLSYFILFFCFIIRSFKKPAFVTGHRVEQYNAEQVEEEELLMF